ncbi:MAG TPA: RidA family protein [Pseudolysinimonas sp.]|nr:RidA family protein [Pseudolysinimonas sp.]
MKTIISTPDAPSSPLFNQGVVAGPFIYVSGMTGTDVATGQLAGPGIQQQTTRALRNALSVVEAGGGTRADIVQVTVLLTHPEDFAGMNEAYGEFFPSEPPARAVTKLGVDVPGLLVSVMMTAYRGE